MTYKLSLSIENTRNNTGLLCDCYDDWAESTLSIRTLNTSSRCVIQPHEDIYLNFITELGVRSLYSILLCDGDSKLNMWKSRNEL